MGNLQLQLMKQRFKVYHNQAFNLDWKLMVCNQQINNRKIVKSKKGKQVFGQLYCKKQSQSIQKILKVQEFRMNFRTRQIVGVYGIYKQEQEQRINISFCGKTFNYTLITQNILCCLGDLGQVQVQNGIYILKSALKGAQLINQQIHIPALYDENKIFFNNQGQCKIWYNDNYSDITSQFQTIKVYEQDIVNSIFQSVQEKFCYSSKYSFYFSQKSQRDISSFSQAFLFLDKFQSSPIKLNNIRFINNYQDKDKCTQKQRTHSKCQKKSLSLQKNKKSTIKIQFLSCKKREQKLIQQEQSRKKSNDFVKAEPLNFRYKTQNYSIIKDINNENTSLSSKFDGRSSKNETTKQIRNQKQRKKENLKKQLIDRKQIKNKFLEINKTKRNNQFYSNQQAQLITQNSSKKVHIFHPSKPTSSISTNNQSFLLKDSILLSKTPQYSQFENNKINIVKSLEPINFSKKKERKLNINPKQKYQLKKFTKQLIFFDNNYTNTFSELNFYSSRSQNIKFFQKMSNQNLSFISSYNNKSSITSTSPRLRKQHSMPLFKNFKSNSSSFYP